MFCLLSVVPDKLRTQIHLFKCKVQGDDGGEQVSQYVMTNLGKRLHKHPDFETNIQKALKDVFLGIDRLFKRDSSIDVSSILATKDVILYLLESVTICGRFLPKNICCYSRTCCLFCFFEL